LDLLKEYLPLISVLSTLLLGVTNLVYTIRRDIREVRKEKAERIQRETIQQEKGVYPRRKDIHQR
jgi:hypothetical protein